MSRKANLLIFVGPTASGKTTRARLLCERLGGNCYFKVVTPFGGLAYMMVRFVTNLILIAYPRYKSVLSIKKHLAFIETYFVQILRKIMPLIILLDFISIVLRVFDIYVHSIRNKVIMLEDFLPQIIVDNMAYMYLYSKKSWLSDKLVKTLYRITVFLNNKIFNKCICMHIETKDEEVLLHRALKRNEPVLNVHGFYNKVLRGELVKKTCKYINCQVREVH